MVHLLVKSDVPPRVGKSHYLSRLNGVVGVIEVSWKLWSDGMGNSMRCVAFGGKRFGIGLGAMPEA